MSDGELFVLLMGFQDYDSILSVINPCLPEVFVCNTSTEGGGYLPLPRFLL